MPWARVAAFVSIAVACGPATKEPPMHAGQAQPSPLAADAVAGVTDPALRAVIADHWEYMMRWSPTWATTLGDHRYDDHLAPRDVASIERSQHERDAIL